MTNRDCKYSPILTLLLYHGAFLTLVAIERFLCFPLFPVNERRQSINPVYQRLNSCPAWSLTDTTYDSTSVLFVKLTLTFDDITDWETKTFKLHSLMITSSYLTVILMRRGVQVWMSHLAMSWTLLCWARIRAACSSRYHLLRLNSSPVRSQLYLSPLCCIFIESEMIWGLTETETKEMKYRSSHRCRPGRLSDWINP